MSNNIKSTVGINAKKSSLNNRGEAKDEIKLQLIWNDTTIFFALLSDILVTSQFTVNQ